MKALRLAWLAALLVGCSSPQSVEPAAAAGAAVGGGFGVAGSGSDSSIAGSGVAGGSVAGSAASGAGAGGSGGSVVAGRVCERDLDCADDERCASQHCEALPCGVRAFVYTPGVESHESVHVAGTFNAWLVSDFSALERDAQSGRYKLVLDVGEGEHAYRLVLDGSDWRLDPGNPATTAQEPKNSQLVVSCAASCRASAADFDWRDQTMYSLLIDRFADSDGQGSRPSAGGDAKNPRFGWGGGDMQGVAQKLGYLSDLGVTALWLSSPAQSSASGYHGYYPAPNDTPYTPSGAAPPLASVDARFGGDAQLQALVTAAHGKGVKVLLDYVMKHADRNSELAQAHPDWFHRVDGGVRLCNAGTPDPGDDIWQDPYWGTRCAFGSALWPFDYDASQAALDWSVRDALWWARTYELDGYRLDAIKHVSSRWSGALRRELVDGLGAKGRDFYLVGETYDFEPSGLRALVDPLRRINGQLDFPLRQRLLEAFLLDQLSLRELAAFVQRNDTYYGSEAVMSTFLGNHDLPRIVHLASRELTSATEGSNASNDAPGQFQQPSDAAAYERLALAFVAQLTSPGIPVIYYGDEIGLAGGGDPENRRMMSWDEAALTEPQRALREVVQGVARARADYKVLGRGKRETLYVDDDVWLYRRFGCADWPSVLVALNRADSARSVQLPAGEHRDILGGASLSGSVQLGRRGFALLEAGAQ